MRVLPVSQVNRWNITDKDGQPLITFTSFLELEYHDESKVLEHPVEEGGFYTYNKIETPVEVSVMLAIAGKNEDLQRILTTLDELVSSTKLINVETPIKLIASNTLVSYDFILKKDDGISLLTVNLALREVRQVKPQYTNVSIPSIPQAQAKNPTDASTQDGGKQQPKEPSKSTIKKIQDSLFGGE